MIPAPETAFLCVGLMTAGTGAIFYGYDRASAASRALSMCLIAIGLRLFLSGADDQSSPQLLDMLVAAVSLSLESVAIYAGVEWGSRIGQTNTEISRPGLRGLFRASQILVVVYWGLNLGYLLIAPESATSDVGGVLRVRGFELAIFAPILGVSILLAGIAIALLRASDIDPAELVRLRALSIAGPFLLAALVLSREAVPVTLTIGLLFFLGGSVGYLVIQSQRGQFMRQFLSPEVARMLQREGTEDSFKRERRLLSVVMCDLRGFTAYARTQDSDVVVTLLERFYDAVGQVAEQHGGTVKDHAGDGVMILVGAPLALADHAYRAVALALDLMPAVQAVTRATAPELGVGIGVATGHTTVGAIRGAGRFEYVAVGNAVNLAARLCDRALDGEVLSDSRTLDELPEGHTVAHEARAPEPLKGFSEPVPVCALGASVPPEHKRGALFGRKRRRSRRSKRSDA